MTTLQNLQQDFLASIQERDHHTILGQIADHKRLTVNQCVDLYRNNHWGVLQKAMGLIYPVVSRLVGIEFFEALVKCYAREHPSHSPSLLDYGESFFDFVATFDHTQSLPYLTDVARLEWKCHQVCLASVSAPIDFNKILSMPEEKQAKMILSLPKQVALLSSDYPVNRIWEVNQDDYLGDQAVNLSSGGVSLVVWQQKNKLYQQVLTDDQWGLLTAIQQTKRFDALCEDLSAQQVDVVSVLPNCVSKGWINIEDV